MSEDTITPTEQFRDMHLLAQIEQNPDISQAGMARELGVAVGTINWHIKRLVAKGFVKVARAQRKKLRYIITPEGLALRARLTVDYVRNQFDLYRQIRVKVTHLLMRMKSNGQKQVRIIGDDEIAEVCRLTCLELGIAVVNSPDAPCIIIDGLKVRLEFQQQVSE